MDVKETEIPHVFHVDLDKNETDYSIESLENQLAEEEQLVQKLKEEAEARAKVLKQKIAKAKKDKRNQELHKLTTILTNLKEEYGNDFVEVVQKMVKPKVIILTEEEEFEYQKFLHIHSRGYKVVGNDVIGFNGNKLNCNIPSQTGYTPKFTMGLNTYIKLYNKYN